MSTPKNQSVIKAFAMLKSFRHEDEWLTSSELSRRAKLPEASGYRLIQTLEEIGAVKRGSKGRYRPGMLLRSLSEKVVISDLLNDAAYDVVDEFARRLNVTSHVGILENGMVTYVTKVATPTSFVLNTRPGAQLEAYCSGLGKMLLSALPEEELDNFVMEGKLVALTPSTITDIGELRVHLRQVRQQGYAVDDREIRPDMSCLAVPIRDPNDQIIGALSATEFAENMTHSRLQQLRMELQNAAHTIGRRVFSADRIAPSAMRSRPRLVGRQPLQDRAA